MYDFKEIETVDPILAGAMQQEIHRQKNTIELIASENFVSKAVMAAMGSPLTNKYAEGYSGKEILWWMQLRRCGGESSDRTR